MLRKLCAGSAMLSLCLGSVTPALAQDYRFAGQDGPQGTNATFNLRIPLGAAARRSRPTFGLTIGYGRDMGAADVDGHSVVRQMRVFDLRFGEDGLRTARIAGVDLARPEGILFFGAKGGEKNTAVVAAMAVGVGAAACVIAGCLGGDDDEEEENEDPVSPGL